MTSPMYSKMKSFAWRSALARRPKPFFSVLMTETLAYCFRWKRWFSQSLPQLQFLLTHSIFVARLIQSESSPHARFSPPPVEGETC